MKKLIILLLFIVLIISCGSQREPKSNTVIHQKYDTVLVESFKNLPLAEADIKPYKIASTYFPATGYNHRVKYIVMHYTAMDNEGSARVLTQKEVSSHYLVQTYNDNNIQLLVPEFERAWHAGISYWRGKENLNDTSIGIEIVNEGYTGDRENMSFYDYPEHQIKKVAKLTQDLIRRYEIEPYNVIGHSDVAPDRKQDPGPKFPWKRLYDEYGIGAWYNESDKQFYMYQFPDENTANSFDFILRYQNDLNRYGYKIVVDGELGEGTRKVIQAFQFHFRPSNFDGVMDRETWAILQALLRKYPPQ